MERIDLVCQYCGTRVGTAKVHAHLFMLAGGNQGTRALQLDQGDLAYWKEQHSPEACQAASDKRKGHPGVDAEEIAELCREAFRRGNLQRLRQLRMDAAGLVLGLRNANLGELADLIGPVQDELNVAIQKLSEERSHAEHQS